MVHRHEDPTTIQAALASITDDFKDELIDIQDPWNIANLGRCFRMGIDLIVQTLNELIEFMSQNPRRPSASYAGHVLDLLAFRVGRLTLCGYNGEDEYADQMDEDDLVYG